MTMPMSGNEKNQLRSKLMREALIIHHRVQLLIHSLALSESQGNDSVYTIIAQNESMDIMDNLTNMEHELHELIDAPVEEIG